MNAEHHDETRSQETSSAQAVETAPAPDQSPPSSAPSTLWRHGDFMRFWLGESISLAGAQVTLLALPLAAVALFGAGAEELGLLRMLQLIPFLVLALPFGVFIDRHRRRPIMIWTNVVRAIAIGLVPLLSVLGMLEMSMLYAVALSVGVATVLFDLCWMSYIPVLVRDRDLLMDANGKIGTTMATAEVVGPGAAGLLIQLITAPIALLVNAISYLVSVVTLLFIRTAEPVPKPPTDQRRRLRSELFEGLRLVVGNPYLRTVTFVGSVFNFVHTYVGSIFLVLAVTELGFTAGLVGVILSVGSVGAVLGTALARTLTRRLPIGRVYTVAATLALAAFALIPAAAGSREVAVGLFMAGFFLSYGGSGVSNIIVVSLRQVLTPHHLMARMTAAARMLLYGGAAFGGPVGGLIAAQMGLRQSLWIAVALGGASVVAIFVSPLPRMRAFPDPIGDA